MNTKELPGLLSPLNNLPNLLLNRAMNPTAAVKDKHSPARKSPSIPPTIHCGSYYQQGSGKLCFGKKSYNCCDRKTQSDTYMAQNRQRPEQVFFSYDLRLVPFIYRYQMDICFCCSYELAGNTYLICNTSNADLTLRRRHRGT